jgi:transcriptional regulator with XRE-family HTH domain
MSLFSDNIRALRVKHKISQRKVAESLVITRGRYVKYEDGTSEHLWNPEENSAVLPDKYRFIMSVDVRKIEVGDLLKLENNRLILPFKWIK